MFDTAFNLLSRSLAVTPEEKVLLIYDDSTVNIADAFRAAAERLGIALSARQIVPTGHHAADPDPETIAMLPCFQVVVAPTYFSLTHCAAFTHAKKQYGLRGATLPGITDELFLQSYADPAEMLDNGKKVLAALQGKRRIRITSAAGTDLTFTIGKAPLSGDTGSFPPGDIGNIPCGEVFTAPDLGTAEGILAVDGSIGSFDDWQPGAETALITLKHGRAVHFSGSRGKALEQALAPQGDSAFVAAEFGIGTNPALTLTGNLLGDEKVKGTIHIAFGNNVSFGGENVSTVHIDNIVLNPSLEADGVSLMQNGEWRF